MSAGAVTRWIGQYREAAGLWNRGLCAVSSSTLLPSPLPSSSARESFCTSTQRHDSAPTQRQPTYSAGDVTVTRTARPDSTLTPRSLRPYPQRMASRNAAGPYEAEGLPLPYYPKRKSPYKRTSAVIWALAREEALRLQTAGRAVLATKMANARSGQIVRVAYTHSLSPEEPTRYFKGIVIAVRRRGLGSTIVLRNVVEGVPVERGFPLYSPLVKDAEVVGQRKVRRSKLYFLRDRPTRESTFPGATKNPEI